MLVLRPRQQYALEMEAKLDQLRSLVEAADRDKVELLNQLEEEKRWIFLLRRPSGASILQSATASH